MALDRHGVALTPHAAHLARPEACTPGRLCLPYSSPAWAACPAPATIVRYRQIQLARVGFEGNVFGLVSRADPTWTYERWERAAAELAQAQAVWQQANALNRVGGLTGVGDAPDSRGVCAPEEDSLS